MNDWSECINIWRVTSFGHRLIKEYIWQNPGEQYRPTNLSTNKKVIFHETTKIGTHENKRIPQYVSMNIN